MRQPQDDPRHHAVFSWRRSAPALLTVLLAATACGEPAPGAGAGREPRALEGGGTHWCLLLPQRAVAQVTGTTALIPSKGPQTAASGSCHLRAGSGEIPVSIKWGHVRPRETREYVREAQVQVAPRPLPDGIGQGFTGIGGVSEPTPWTSMVVFGCGKREPYVRIRLGHLAGGRDARSDLVDLTRAARDRYGEVNRCEPRPA